MAEIDIILCKQPDELHCHYQGQSQAQAAYIELDLVKGTLWATYNAEIGNGIPMTVYHGYDRQYAIPDLTGDAANRVMNDIKPLAERILDDWDEEWDGSNYNVTPGRDAQAAEAEIEQRLGLPQDPHEMPFDIADLVQEIGACDWMTGSADEAAELGITGTTTDTELAGIATTAREAAMGCDYAYTVINGLEEYLRDLRETVQGASADD